jgi:hypothetical protein
MWFGPVAMGRTLQRRCCSRHSREGNEFVRIDNDKGRRLPAGSSWPMRANVEQVE